LPPCTRESEEEGGCHQKKSGAKLRKIGKLRKMKSLRIKIVLAGLIAFRLFLYSSESANSMDHKGISEANKDSYKVLKEIYREVKELGKFPGDDFIKREFFIGPGKDDTYKDIHVLVLIQNIEEKERITIQVTYLQRSENNPTIKYAKNVRSISCLYGGDKIDIVKSDYDKKERKTLLPDVLRAIRDKKKLLKKSIKKISEASGGPT
jgi:hypothetical protein